MTSPHARTDHVRLLTVCTGNICRSPYAAVSLAHQLSVIRPGVFHVASAGTHALIGRPIEPGSRNLLQAQGMDDPSFRARQLSNHMARAQDLILVMTDEHRGIVLDEAPHAHRKTFMIREFAHLLEEVSAQHDWHALFVRAGVTLDVVSRWRALPAVLRAAGRGVRTRRRDQSVIDPMGGPPRQFTKMASEIDPAIATIVAWERQFGR